MELKINPGVKELPKVDVIEQRADYIKSRMEYSNGFIMISEIDAGNVSISANFNWLQVSNEEVKPDFNSPNNNFIDIN